MDKIILKSETTDYTGRRFGRLQVIRPNVRIGRKRMWECICDCGEYKLVRQDHLRKGRIVSCGCFKAENSSQVNSTHRLSLTKEYTTWQRMKIRCYRPSDKSYPNYGGRGITVCERWFNSFEAFYKDIGPAPGLLYSIERIDNDGNYEPGNCKWATREEQARNTRATVWIELDNIRKPLIAWAESLGIGVSSLRRRLAKWPKRRALTKPKKFP